MLYTIFALLIVFQLKHYICDYLLQNEYMLGKFKPGWNFVLPLLAHSIIHGAATFGICMIVAPNLWWLSLVDLITHFCIDRVKASPNLLGRFKVMSGKEMMEAKKYGEETYCLTEPTQIKRKKEFNKKVKHNTYFWYALGLDQMLHHFIDYFIIFMFVRNV